MIKLNLGLSKKIGQPDFGSLGASCHVEVDVDGSLIDDNLDAFHDRVQQAYVACRQAVNDELARHDQQPASPAASTRSQSIGNGHGRAAGNGHRATDKQLDYARQLARQIDELGVRRLDDLADRMFDKPLAALTTLDASGLIDMLKSLKSGEVRIEDALGKVTQ